MTLSDTDLSWMAKRLRFLKEAGETHGDDKDGSAVEVCYTYNLAPLESFNQKKLP
jgi:hypothetical protein